MSEAYLELLQAFHFTEMQAWIATISALLFVSNLFGGILSAMTFVYSNQLARRPLSERISFRLFILSEVLLLIFIFFYHVFMIETMKLDHAVYWFSASLMMPLLAIIGSQMMLVIFTGKMNAKEAELRRRHKLIREKRRKEADEAGDHNGPSPLQKKAAARKAAADKKAEAEAKHEAKKH